MFGDSTGLYFYSATLQADAALLSVFAIFVIFRMQQYDAAMGQIGLILLNDPSINFLRTNAASEFLQAPIEEKRRKAAGYNGPLRNFTEQWILAYDRNSAVKSKLKVPTFSFAGLMILSLFGITLTDWVHVYSQILEGLAMVGIALLNAVAIVHLGYSVISITE